MRYKIFENGTKINSIEADFLFVSAYCQSNGYTFEEDPLPEPEPEPEPTQLDRIEAQTVYTAMMTDTLMEG